jgi:replication initiation and membrane attachment protein DnaB
MENSRFNPINVGAGSLNNPKVKDIIKKLAAKYNLSNQQIFDIVDSQFMAARQAIREGKMDDVHSFKNIQFIHIGKIVMSKTKLIRFLHKLNAIFPGEYQQEFDNLIIEFPNTELPKISKEKLDTPTMRRLFNSYNKQNGTDGTDGTTDGTESTAESGTTTGTMAGEDSRESI